MSAWGYVTGTGLDAIDYLFADEVMIPEQARRYFNEEVVYLPCLMTYMPQAEPPPITSLPAGERGFVTFGYFNNYAKLSEPALGLWAELLKSIPSSRMLFKAKEFGYPQPCQRVLQAFARVGIAPERLSFLGASPWYEHLKTYCSVDIALDPFPYVGGISTLEALWMGTPVVTLRGEAPTNRASASILTAIGLNDWIAESPDHYLAIARRQAQDIPALERLRSTLRNHTAASPIGNARHYVRTVETIYRNLWRRWCTAQDATSAASERN